MKSITLIRPAIYARVSCEQQVQQQTIASQVAALRDRVTADGLALDEELVFVDDGCSGSSLMRPAMDRLRDMAYSSAFDRLYVHSPDRLARKYAYQVLLMDELKHEGIEVVFLNRSIGETPEEELLLQVQGVIAEYERAKIIERSRRGRRHAAQRGSLNAIAHAPYGYRYINKHQAGGEAYYQLVPDEAAIIRQMFEWVGYDRLSLAGIRRRLHEQGLRSPKGNEYWNRASICDMLKNTAYQGLAAYGKTRVGERLPRLRAPRNQPDTPRRSHTCHDTPPSEQIRISVPAIVSEELFLTVQEQLEEDRQRQREQRQSGAQYLLQGLTLCNGCGSAYCGRHGRKGGRYAYYRCLGGDAYRFGGQRICNNKQIPAAALEAAVWNDVQELLRDPDAVRQEYERRLRESVLDDTTAGEQLASQIKSARRTISRLIDVYADELLTKDEFEPRLRTAKARLARLESQSVETAQRQSQRAELKHVIGQLNDFAEQLRNGLNQADWTSRREIIRILVKTVKIESDNVRITYRINPRPFADGPARGRSVQHCRRFAATPAGVETKIAAPTCSVEVMPSCRTNIVLFVDPPSSILLGHPPAPLQKPENSPKAPASPPKAPPPADPRAFGKTPRIFQRRRVFSQNARIFLHPSQYEPSEPLCAGQNRIWCGRGWTL
jgi:site-specific DNA recombinase